jgi:hypothetical protein
MNQTTTASRSRPAEIDRFDFALADERIEASAPDPRESNRVGHLNKFRLASGDAARLNRLVCS